MGGSETCSDGCIDRDIVMDVKTKPLAGEAPVTGKKPVAKETETPVIEEEPEVEELPAEGKDDWSLED